MWFLVWNGITTTYINKMYSFLIAIATLILGYVIYGRFIDKVFGVDSSRVTPAFTKRDNIDYVPMPSWKVYMVQFLNIAGTGPIFGAIMGAHFGPACYLWIVFGSIFAGGVHDYLSGMISLRNGGMMLNDIVGKYLGRNMRIIMNILLFVLLILTGTVFIYSPALILDKLTSGLGLPILVWIVVIFAYYFVATLLPIDKIIGKIYPIFAVAMLFMAVSLGVCLFVKWPLIPEMWDSVTLSDDTLFQHFGRGEWERPGALGSIFPMLFVTVACGAISGFHATQCPLMARCLKNEKMGRPIFYGSMITEGVVALIWAAISSYYFFGHGALDMELSTRVQAPAVVTSVSIQWLGIVGGVLAIIGVVVAPISTGDTALRACRLMAADLFKIKQDSWYKIVLVAIPIFTLVLVCLLFNIYDPNGFDTIWRYFGWINQSLSGVTLWALVAFFVYTHKGYKPYYIIALVPAIFVTTVCFTYICITKIGFNIPQYYTPFIAGTVLIIQIVLFTVWFRKTRTAELPERMK